MRVTDFGKRLSDSRFSNLASSKTSCIVHFSIPPNLLHWLYMLESEPRPTPEFPLPSEMLPDNNPVFDPYDLAHAEVIRRLEALQQAGEMRKPSEIETQEELDDHFDELSRLYRQVCGEMDLPWPPPAISLPKEVAAEFDLEASGWV